MSSIGSISEPFEQCDTDTASVSTTGDTLNNLFTNLAFTTGRGIMLQNRGANDVLFGKSLATARWRITPNAILTLYPKDLAKIALKSNAGANNVDCILIV